VDRVSHTLNQIPHQSAVKRGEKLSQEEMEVLIKDWLSSRYPAPCLHGCLICYRMEYKDIARKLDRH
jgi:DNA mismatch repair protein MutL